MRVAFFESDDAFDKLADAWRALADRSRVASIFSTWEWQSSWWRHYGVGSGNRLRLLTVWDDANSLVALLPYYIASVRVLGYVPKQEALLIGTGGDTSPDYMGALIDPTVEGAATRLLIDSFMARRHEWDVLRFLDVQEGLFAEELQRALTTSVRFATTELAWTIRVARLPASWDEYLASLDNDRRKRVRYQRRNAEKKIAATMHVCKEGDGLTSAFENLIRLHRKRWGENEGSFRTSKYVEFHREAIQKCRDRGWVRLYCLNAGEETAAVLYCYQYRDELLFFQSGFDPAQEKFSVGQILLGYAFESAIGESLKTFDMLKGDHAYKRSWSNDTRRTYEITAWRPTAAGLLSLGRYRLAKMRRRPPNDEHPATAEETGS
jgi:CelD/BcsL family acetyltransferase involved in cellulose biosynthesis